MSTGSETLEIDDNLVKLHSRRDAKVTKQDEEKIDLLNGITNPKKRKWITQDILANAPKVVQSGSVGERLYVCAKNVENGLFPPECLNGGYTPGVTKCDKHIYERTINGMKKIYTHTANCKEAYVYITGSAKTEITLAEKEQLSKDGVEKAIIFNRKNGNIRYEKTMETSTKTSWEELDSSETETCETETATACEETITCSPVRKSKSEKSNWIFWIFIIVIVIIAFLLLLGYAGMSYYNKNTTTTTSTSSGGVSYFAAKSESCHPLNEHSFYSGVSV